MEQAHPHVAVLIPAAGTGSRLGGRPKQFRRLGEESLLGRAVRLFDEHPRTTSIIVAVPRDDVSRVERELAALTASKLYDIVPGGENRQASVEAALHAAPQDADIVLVHDAARPFLPSTLIDEVMDAALEHGAAAPALAVSDTLRRAEGNIFGATVSRDGLHLMQTPQGAQRELLDNAFRAARRDGIVATDEVALLERTGVTVRLVQGSAVNFKVTTPEDWELALAVWHHLVTAA